VSALPRASELGLIACTVCGLVCRNVPGDARLDGDGVGDDMACPRCGTTLHRRKPDSYMRTWALLIAAFILYIPANVLPIMRTASLNDVDDNTIISGVVELWRAGSPNLAIIVFTASIVVPVLKFLALGTLLVSSQQGSGWARVQRAKLYRLVELIGGCRTSIHDLSRVSGTSARFNMPFELGLATALKAIGHPHDFFLFESQDRRIDKTLSDLKGIDAQIHGGTQRGAIGCLLDCFGSTRATPKIEDLVRTVRRLSRAAAGLKRAQDAKLIFRRVSFASSSRQRPSCPNPPVGSRGRRNRRSDSFTRPRGPAYFVGVAIVILKPSGSVSEKSRVPQGVSAGGL